MNDEQLIAAFESCELPASRFTHADHVHVAWCYLTRYRFAQARERFCEALKRFATAAGAPDRYHETITVAYLLIIADRLQNAPETSWARFADRNAELFGRDPSILAHYYSDKLLQSAHARHEFVKPDRHPLGPHCRRLLEEFAVRTQAPDARPAPLQGSPRP